MANHLSTVINALETLAPLRLAGSWDNVGLLLEPTATDPQISTGFLTIDLNEAVLQEAIECGAQMIVSYHPILFAGVKSITQSNAHTRMLLKAIGHEISIYSPHTALDAVVGGVNDWLLESLGGVDNVVAIEPAPMDVSPTGMGRSGTLKNPLTLEEVIPRLKAYLSLPTLRVAATPHHASGQRISSLAVCPGAGGSLLADLSNHDLVITGELRHHDVLGLNARGCSVILTEHTNCERGYLPRLQAQLTGQLGSETTWRISTVDQDPLIVR